MREQFMWSRGTATRLALGAALISVAVVATAGSSALAQSCGPIVFGNGFEMGDLSDWSSQAGLAAPPGPPTVFRVDSLALRDPHVLVELDVLGCFDVTDNVPLTDSINDLIDASINTDGDMDGCLDSSPLVALRPLVTTAVGGEVVDFRSGACADATTCGPGQGGAGSRSAYSTQAMGTCLQPLAGTTSGYSPTPSSPSGPCFMSPVGDISLAFVGGVPLNLRAAQLAAGFAGDPTTELIEGLMFGFLLESEAEQLILPANLPVVGGKPLSSLFPGGADNCAGSDDRDVHESESGWWIYLDFTAKTVPWQYL